MLSLSLSLRLSCCCLGSSSSKRGDTDPRPPAPVTAADDTGAAVSFFAVSPTAAVHVVRRAGCVRGRGRALRWWQNEFERRDGRRGGGEEGAAADGRETERSKYTGEWSARALPPLPPLIASLRTIGQSVGQVSEFGHFA